MKKLIIAAAALAFASVASAGEYHVGKFLLCYDCHSMHGSQAHGFAGGAVGTGAANSQLFGDWQAAQGTVYEFLLKGAHSDSCIACHDGRSFAPDVVGVNANSYARSGGGIADGVASGYETFKGHTIGATGPIPGGTGSMQLECMGCHIQHGSANSFRNLGNRSNTATQPSYAVGATLNTTVDVTINVAAGAIVAGKYMPQVDGVFGSYYNMDAVSYAARDVVDGTTTYTSSNRLNNLCAMCHGVFHGNPTAGAVGNGATGAGVGGVSVPDADVTDMTGVEAFTRHPTAGVKLGGLVPIAPATSNHGHTAIKNLSNKTNKVKAAQSAAGTFDSASPMCISCHNAHGSTHAFGLRYLAGNQVNATPADLENGIGRYANLCNQCHSQGTSNVEDYTGFSRAADVQ
jgi:hypothetical protein